MTHWNHRVIVKESFGDTIYAIHEVYYDDNNVPHSWTLNPCKVTGVKIEEVKQDLERMMKCLDQPHLRIVDDKLVEVIE